MFKVGKTSTSIKRFTGIITRITDGIVWAKFPGSMGPIPFDEKDGSPCLKSTKFSLRSNTR